MFKTISKYKIYFFIGLVMMNGCDVAVIFLLIKTKICYCDVKSNIYITTIKKGCGL